MLANLPEVDGRKIGRRGSLALQWKNDIFLWCESPDRAVQGRDSGADGAGLPKVSCYTGTQSPLDIYHHLLHRLRQEWQVSCTTTEQRRGPNGELRYYLGTLELLKRKRSTIKLPNSTDTISTAVATSTTARPKITSLYDSTCIWLIQGHAHKRNLSSTVCNLQEDDKKSDMNLTLCHN